MSTLPPAKRGEHNRLQHSSKVSVERPSIREATEEEKAKGHERVREGIRLAGHDPDDAAGAAARHAAKQEHVPRMVNWINDVWDRGLDKVDRPKPKREWGGTQVYIRPGDEGHSTH